METSPNESIKNNVIGTYKTAYAALKHGASRFILISTDKAVNPTNIMGASKRLCEMVIQSMDAVSKAGRMEVLPLLHAHMDKYFEDQIPGDRTAAVMKSRPEERSSVHIENVKNKDRQGTQFVAVRFGNVLGSNGSVIPLFKKQIEAGGPVTVTHPDIVRYFMTIPEAVSLVLQAGTYAWGGEIFVLDMGEPVKIDSLARNLIKLSGYEPDVEIPIVYSGLRPGEKLYEEKLMAEEGMKKTDNDLIHIGKPIPFDISKFLGQLTELAQASYENSPHIVEMVEEIVPTSPVFAGYPALCEGAKRYDAVVTGSDQLWSPAGLPTNYYNLMFVPDFVRKISYASSFGVSQIPWYQVKYRAAYRLVAEPGSSEYEKENQAMVDDGLLWLEFYKNIPDDFAEMIKAIMKRKGITQENLSFELGVDRKALLNYLNQDRPSVAHVVGICVALKVITGQKLLSTFRAKFSASK